MSVYKKVSEKTNKVSWFTSFYYIDWQGKRRQKKKEGFSTRKEALEYERDFLQNHTTTPNILFKNLCSAYVEYKKSHVKAYTLINIERATRRLCLYFGDMNISDITPAHVSRWQQQQLKEHKRSTVSIYHSQLSALFNYAMRFNGLMSNPAKIAGNVKVEKDHTKIKFWTLEQFNTFQQGLKERHSYLLPFFTLLFWSGIREGEALALTVGDFDFNNNTVDINKTFHKIKGGELVNAPKTPRSKRVIPIPGKVMAMIKEHISHIAYADNDTRIFEAAPSVGNIQGIFRRESARLKLPHIVVHDLRHSHASLLISQGVQPMVIRDRLGHESISITLDTYSHLYPQEEKKMSQLLDKLANKKPGKKRNKNVIKNLSEHEKQPSNA